jgi:hypothetical protein
MKLQQLVGLLRIANRARDFLPYKATEARGKLFSI